MNSEPIKFTEVKDKRLLKATPTEREKLIFVDNSYNVYVGGVGESLQRNCGVRLRYYWAGLKALPCRIPYYRKLTLVLIKVLEINAT